MMEQEMLDEQNLTEIPEEEIDSVARASTLF